MKSSTDYKLAQNFGMLLIGSPKSGKTTLTFAFPGLAILDCDKNLDGAVRYAKGKQFKFDDPYEAEPNKRWAHCMQFMKAACADPTIKTIIIDGLSHLANFLIDGIISDAVANPSKETQLKVAGEPVMNMSYWRPFQMRMIQLVMAGRASGKIFIVTCHEEIVQDDKSGSVVGYRPLISGALKNHLAGLFSDVWRTEVSSINGKTSYSIRVAPKNLHQIGNSLGIPETSITTTDLTPDKLWDTKLKRFFGDNSTGTK